MRRLLLIKESRSEHAKLVRRLTGTNGFRDKRISFLPPRFMQCIGTSLTKDNLVLIAYD